MSDKLQFAAGAAALWIDVRYPESLCDWDADMRIRRELLAETLALFVEAFAAYERQR